MVALPNNVKAMMRFEMHLVVYNNLNLELLVFANVVRSVLNIRTV